MIKYYLDHSVCRKEYISNINKHKISQIKKYFINLLFILNSEINFNLMFDRKIRRIKINFLKYLR